MKKLVQTGEDSEGVFNVMDGLSFVRAMNENADELGTSTKLDLENYNTPEAIAKALKEQAGKTGYHTPGGPDDLPTFEETGAPIYSPSEQKGGIAQVYNEAIEGGETGSKVVEIGEEDITLNFKDEITSDLVDIHAKSVNGEELTEEEVEKLNKAIASLVRYNGEVETTVVTIANPRYESFIEIGSSDEGNPETALYVSTKTKDAFEDGWDADVTALTKDGWYGLERAPRDGEEHEHEYILTSIEEPVSVNFKELTNIHDADGNELETYDTSEFTTSVVRPTYMYRGGNYKVTAYDTYDKEAVDEYTELIKGGSTIDYGFTAQGYSGSVDACGGNYAYVSIDMFSPEESRGIVYAYLSPDLGEFLGQRMENIDVSEVTDYGWYKAKYSAMQGEEDDKLVKCETPENIEIYGIDFVGDGTGNTEKVKVDGYIKAPVLDTFEDSTADFTLNFSNPQELSSGIYVESNNDELVNSFATAILGNYPETKELNDLPFSSIIELRQGDLSLKGYAYLADEPDENYYQIRFTAKEAVFSFYVYLGAEGKELEFKAEDDSKSLLDTLPEFNWHNTIPH